MNKASADFDLKENNASNAAPNNSTQQQQYNMDNQNLGFFSSP